jgi:hypothetical protein
MDLKETTLESVNWIRLAQNMEKWRAFVNLIMNYLRFSQ